MSLTEKLTQPDPKRKHVVTECCNLIDQEVRSKGFMIKGAYKVVKAVKPRFVSEVVDGMLDEWVGRLQPFWDSWQQDGAKGNFGTYLTGHQGDVAEALLQVTDGRAKNAKNGTVKKMYEKMRPSAKRNVEEALPRLGEFIEKEAAAVQ